MSASPINWQKSSFSGGGGENCVELAQHDGNIVMRESDDPATIITTSPEKLRAFLLGVKAGEFDHLVS
ncbi:DUF397 domain-containing protein [Streptomyces thermolilacinus]|uniref:DUF397 domain-containing protein n=1 Tax=Streptomyces thermolilacinus TaxID=285540 RepID=UPI0033FC617E